MENLTLLRWEAHQQAHLAYLPSPAPYLPVPEFAATKVWPSCEMNDMIMVWYHCDGTSPAWQVAEQEGASSPDWAFRAGTEHFVSAHIEVVCTAEGRPAAVPFQFELSGIQDGLECREAVLGFES